MKLSFVVIIYRSNSSIALDTSRFCENILSEKNIHSYRIESDFKDEQIKNYLSKKKTIA